MNIFDSVHDATADRQNQIHRTLIGSLYGFLGATAFTLLATVANIMFYRDLPMGIAWDWFLSRWPVFALSMALIGALTCWFGPIWAGLLAGAIATGLIALVSALTSSMTSIAVRVIVVLFTIMPTTVMSLPLAIFLRWLVTSYGKSKPEERKKKLISLGLVAILTGVVLGIFAKMPKQAETAVRVMNEAMQTSQDKVIDTAGYSEHAGQPFHFFQKESQDSTEGFDVTALYEDGYSLTCTVVVYPGATPYLLGCSSNP